MQSGEETVGGGGGGAVAQDTVRETGVGQITQDLPGQDETFVFYFYCHGKPLMVLSPKMAAVNGDLSEHCSFPSAVTPFPLK